MTRKKVSGKHLKIHLQNCVVNPWSVIQVLITPRQYQRSVYTTQVNNTFCPYWLEISEVITKYCSLLRGRRDKITRRHINFQIDFLYIDKKKLFFSVSVWYLLLCVHINATPLRRITVNCWNKINNKIILSLFAVDMISVSSLRLSAMKRFFFGVSFFRYLSEISNGGRPVVSCHISWYKQVSNM